MIYNKCPRCGEVIRVEKKEISDENKLYRDKIVNISSNSSIVKEYCPKCGYISGYVVEFDLNKKS